jgi:hypothetical protein
VTPQASGHHSPFGCVARTLQRMAAWRAS